MPPPMTAPLNFPNPPPNMHPPTSQIPPPMNTPQIPMGNIHQPSSSHLPPGLPMPPQSMPVQPNVMKIPGMATDVLSPPGMLQYQHPGAPPASPQSQNKEENSGTQTGELISFD